LKEILAETEGNYRHRLQLVAQLCSKQSKCEAYVDDNAGGEALPDLMQHAGCGRFQPKYRRSAEKGRTFDIKLDWTKRENADDTEVKQEISAEVVYEIFKQITDETVRVLGMDPKFSRPDWMIVTVLPVPPLAVRPAVEMDEGGAAHDDLTFQLSDILKCNDNIRENEQSGAAPHVISDAVTYLQFKVATLVDNELPNMPQSSQVRAERREWRATRIRPAVFLCVSLLSLPYSSPLFTPLFANLPFYSGVGVPSRPLRSVSRESLAASVVTSWASASTFPRERSSRQTPTCPLTRWASRVPSPRR
jgi:DNA-directed RNA polymerase beta' subunit